MPIPDSLIDSLRTLVQFAWAPPPPLDVLGLRSWLHQNVAGAAIVEDTPLNYQIEVYLVTPVPPNLQLALFTQLGPWGLGIRFSLTGRFRFLEGPGIGSGISMYGHTGGKVGLFVKDAQGGAYALTCAHVLDESPNGQVVSIDGQPIGKLEYKLPISTAGMTAPGLPEPNHADGALAGIPNAPPNISQDGRPIAGFANYNDGDTVLDSVTSGKLGTIRSTLASVKIFYAQGGCDVFFGNVILVSTKNATLFAEPGDSGSLVLTEPQNAAVGLAFAAPENLLTGAPAGLLPSISVVVCDLHQTLAALEQQMPSALRPLSFA
jgi:hypothetical protein